MQKNVSQYACPVCNGAGHHETVREYLNNFATPAESVVREKGQNVPPISDYTYKGIDYVLNADAPPRIHCLIPPRMPDNPQKKKWNFWGMVMLVLTFICILLEIATVLFIAQMNFPLLMMIAVCFHRYIRNNLKSEQDFQYRQNAFEREQLRYERQLAVWEKLQICVTDHVLYNPYTGKSATSGVAAEIID